MPVSCINKSVLCRRQVTMLEFEEEHARSYNELVRCPVLDMRAAWHLLNIPQVERYTAAACVALLLDRRHVSGQFRSPVACLNLPAEEPQLSGYLTQMSASSG